MTVPARLVMGEDDDDFGPWAPPTLTAHIGRLRLQLHAACTAAAKQADQPPPLMHLTLRKLQLGGAVLSLASEESPLELRGSLSVGGALVIDERSAHLGGLMRGAPVRLERTPTRTDARTERLRRQQTRSGGGTAGGMGGEDSTASAPGVTA
eukprot:3059708-Prymnesium_polylepis.2